MPTPRASVISHEAVKPQISSKLRFSRTTTASGSLTASTSTNFKIPSELQACAFDVIRDLIDKYGHDNTKADFIEVVEKFKSNQFTKERAIEAACDLTAGIIAKSLGVAAGSATGGATGILLSMAINHAGDYVQDQVITESNVRLVMEWWAKTLEENERDAMSDQFVLPFTDQQTEIVAARLRRDGFDLGELP